MKPSDPRRLVLAAWVLSGIATLASINFSGIPPLGWRGMGFIPCDLCWYQRILMYPLPLLLGLAWWRMERSMVVASVSLAGAGGLVALYHSLVELSPSIELGSCSLIDCASSPWRWSGLTIPNLSLMAFVAITALLGMLLAVLRQRDAAAPREPGVHDAH